MTRIPVHLPATRTARRAAVVIALAALGVLVPLGTAAGEPVPTPTPDPTPTPGPTPMSGPASTSVSTPSSVELAGRETDDRGFVASSARCAADQSAVALGVTRASLVVVCLIPSGGVDYRGVRLVDGAATQLPATAAGTGFRAVADGGVTYDVTASALTVTVRGASPRVEPMVAYRQPRLAAEGGPERTPAPTTTTAVPTESAVPSGERGAAEVGSPAREPASETFGPVTTAPTR